MATLICPICNQVVYAPDNQEFVVCNCNEVIYVRNEALDCEDEESSGIS